MTAPRIAFQNPPAELLARFDVPGPRYTSYPTADRFVEAFGMDDYGLALQQRHCQPRVHQRPLSLYVHIPFCAQLCYYCACNKVITRHPERADAYLHHLEQEAALVVQHLQASSPEAGTNHGPARLPEVSQLHLGGGSPTFLSDEQLTTLMVLLRRHFHLMPDAECSVEVDPRTVDAARLAHLRQIGFNRLSLGVQDFNPKVQEAVHRVQATQEVFSLMLAARALGFHSINVDLIYGLPRQSHETFAHTLVLLLALRPDRVALYGYAHLPERFKAQRRIDAQRLPDTKEKVAMQVLALQALAEAGYINIGMDHFALPGDSLAMAKARGQLHRNFQGYSTQPDSDLIGLGVSAISKVGTTYSQNARELDEYYDRLEQEELPVVRGLALNRDDLVRRTVIMALMCQGVVQFEAVELANLLDFKTYFAQELQALEEFAEQGLVHISDTSIEVTDSGWTFIRAIAMVFDRYLQADRNRNRFSRIL